MLEETNRARVAAGVPPVPLGDNTSPQTHAEHALANCYSAHWDQWGLKPLYRYALAGGDQYASENGSGIDYCPSASDNHRAKRRDLWEGEVREAVEGWLSSPGHRRNLLNPKHTVMHAGIAMGQWHTSMMQVFSGDYVSWTDKPDIKGTTLTASGQLGNGARTGGPGYSVATMEYHPPPERLAPGQLSMTYCLESDIRIGIFLEPLPPGWYYTSDRDGSRYTDYDIGTAENEQCVNPYEIPAGYPPADSWEEASQRHEDAVRESSLMRPETSTLYKIVAQGLGVSKNGQSFDIKADIAPILAHYGPGIYTLSLWAAIGPETEMVAEYPIWWRATPPDDHPYGKGRGTN